MGVNVPATMAPSMLLGWLAMNIFVVTGDLSEMVKDAFEVGIELIRCDLEVNVHVGDLISNHVQLFIVDPLGAASFLISRRSALCLFSWSVGDCSTASVRMFGNT